MSNEDKFEPQHHHLPDEEIEKMKNKRMHITIHEDVGYHLRCTAALLTIKKLTYNQIIKLLLLRFKYPKGDLRDRPEFKAILEGA